jgi:hypothetical protein
MQDGEILLLNKKWRFDLKLVGSPLNDPVINCSLDFKGFNKDHNPKYYELTKLVAGNFLDPHNTTLFTISTNCKDIDFDGSFCKETENISYLPNTFNFYSLSSTQ